MSDPKQPRNVMHCFLDGQDWHRRYVIMLDKSTYRHNRIGWYALYFIDTPDGLHEFGDNEEVIREVTFFGDHLGREVSWGSLPENLCQMIVEKMQNPVYGE